MTSINKPPYISHSTTSSIDLRFPVTTKITNNNDQDKSIPTSLSSSPITKSGLLNMDDAELISKSIIGDEFFNNIQETGVNFGISNLVTSKFSLASLKLPNFGNIQKENETEEENK